MSNLRIEKEVFSTTNKTKIQIISKKNLHFTHQALISNRQTQNQKQKQ